MDLLSTRIGLKLGYVETRLFGNNMLLEYSVFLGVILILQVLGIFFASHYGKEWFRKLGLVLAYSVAMLPFIAVIHNLNVLMS